MIIILILIALLVVFLTVFYYYLVEETKPLHYKCDTKLDGKTVLITGATSGIGKATASKLAACGARVILACRNRQKADATCEEIQQETGNKNITVLDLDLSDLDSVKSAAEEVNKTESRLDVLINNAAIGFTDSECSKQGFDLTFATNYLGHFLLTHLLLDLMKKSAPSRIINVTSKVYQFITTPLDFTLHREGSNVKYSKLEGYMVSKLANIYHSRFLSEDLVGTKVTINNMHPGIVKTNVMNKPVNDPCKRFINYLCARGIPLFGRTSDDAAETLVYMAVDPELTEVTGEHFENVSIKTNKMTALALDKEQARKMREVSFLACKDYLDLPEDIAKVEEVGAVQEESSVQKEEKSVDDIPPSTTEGKTDLENDHSPTSSTPSESSIPTKAVETSVAAATAAATLAESETEAEKATETLTAATVAPTISAPEVHAFSESDLPAPACPFTPSLDIVNNKNLEEIENLSSHVCSSANENKETIQESVYKPLILPEITEANEHYPPTDGDSNLNCDTTNVCSDRTSSSREDSPLITLDDTENSDNLHEEETF